MKEDLKYGEKYRLELLCKSQTKNIIVFETPTGDLLPLRANDLECVSPIPERENTESAHKYDPCRLFKEGDIVEPCQVKGRWFGTAWKKRSGILFTVTTDEDEEGVMWVQDPDSLHAQDVEAVFFRLVTPVEELEPHFIEESNDGATIVWTVKKRNCSQGLDFRYCPGWGGNIFFSENHCRKHAEAECKRLNAEYRKENSHE